MASKKDYEVFAAILQREWQKLDEGVEREPRLALTILSNKIMGYFKNDNPDFDWDRFAEACKPIETPKATSGCFCTNCLRNVDEDTFDELDGMCELCDTKFQNGEL